MILFFDTETTGLVPGRIIQLSYILFDGKSYDGKNFYFAVDYIPEESTKVHGITVDLLYKLSGGKVFSDYAEEIYNDFISADLIVAHNVNFDISFMIAEFERIGLRFRYNESLDTMKYLTPIMRLKRNSGTGYKYPKLSEAIEFSRFSERDVEDQTAFCFKVKTLSYHDARFDATAVLMLFEADAYGGGELQTFVDKYANGKNKKN